MTWRSSKRDSMKSFSRAPRRWSVGVSRVKTLVCWSSGEGGIEGYIKRRVDAPTSMNNTVILEFPYIHPRYRSEAETMHDRMSGRDLRYRGHTTLRCLHLLLYCLLFFFLDSDSPTFPTWSKLWITFEFQKEIKILNYFRQIHREHPWNFEHLHTEGPYSISKHHNNCHSTTKILN